MAETDPGVPSKCLVFGWVIDAQGNAQASVAVNFKIFHDDAFTSTGKSVRKEAETATTDSAGYFEISLFPSAKLIPAGTKYQVTIPNIGFAKRVQIPDQSTARLDTLS